MSKISDAYLGNQNLKRANVKHSWEPKQIQEWMKCATDPEYFIETYIKIVNIDAGLVNFKMYEYQKEIVELAVDERFVICKMPRQCGKTTTIVGVMLWYILFHENYSVAILAHKLAQAREILSRIQLAYEHLPKWIQQGIVGWNKGNIELENGSKILASATSSSAIRGGSFNMIYLDEFAFVENNMQESFFASVYPTISSGQSSKVLITSTPNGLNLFYKLWVDSEEGKNDYKRVDVHWSQVPGRDEAWKEATIRNTSEEQFRVEFECEFIGSSHTLISATKLRMLRSIPALVKNEDTSIFEQPIEGHSYVTVVDTARGVMGDYSAFVIFDVSQLPYKVVASYRNNMISALLYPNIVYQLSKHYNNSYILVEVNDIGEQVVNVIKHDFEYENVFTVVPNGRSGQIISGGFGGKAARYGVRTTKQVKRIGCLNLKTQIESDKLLVQDERILYELFRFVNVGESYEAEEGHDDMVMCLVLFAWAMNQDYVKELTSVDLRQKIEQEAEETLEENMLPFGIIYGGELADSPVIAAKSDDDSWLFRDDAEYDRQRLEEFGSKSW
jgi:Terminase large subunit, T4likevirus-type, N-terminal/Terminase RNaseH-like domain